MKDHVETQPTGVRVDINTSDCTQLHRGQVDVENTHSFRPPLCRSFSPGPEVFVVFEMWTSRSVSYKRAGRFVNDDYRLINIKARSHE